MTEPLPRRTLIWSRAISGLIAVICILALAAGFKAHSGGILMNVMIIALVLGMFAALLLRLPFAILGQIDWTYLRRPFAVGRRHQWVHIGLRIVFWGLCLAVLWIGIPHKQLPPDVRLASLGSVVFAGFVLILMSLFPKRLGFWPMSVFSGVAILLLGTVLARSIFPGLTSGETVRLHTPFSGEAYALQAGHDELINYHVAHTSQKHALDMIVLGENGHAYSGKEKEQDPCFGAELISPVDGKIIGLVSNLQDNEIGATDRDNPAGNHVVIEMDATHYAMLGHMKQGSAQVAIGDVVSIGDPLGQCGNSGNTSGPHLHIQVQRYPDLFAKGGYTYPIRFDGTTRVRGAKVRSADGLYYRRNDIIKAR